MTSLNAKGSRGRPRVAARSWPVQDAKARFSELLELACREGPQVVSKRGVDAAVLVPIAAWRRMQSASRPSLKELLLASHARAEIPIPARGRLRRRPAR